MSPFSPSVCGKGRKEDFKREGENLSIRMECMGSNVPFLCIRNFKNCTSWMQISDHLFSDLCWFNKLAGLWPETVNPPPQTPLPTVNSNMLWALPNHELLNQFIAISAFTCTYNTELFFHGKNTNSMDSLKTKILVKKLFWSLCEWDYAKRTPSENDKKFDQIFVCKNSSKYSFLL